MAEGCVVADLPGPTASPWRDLITRTGLGMEHVAERAGFGLARHTRRVWRQFHPAAPSRLRGASCP